MHTAGKEGRASHFGRMHTQVFSESSGEWKRVQEVLPRKPAFFTILLCACVYERSSYWTRVVNKFEFITLLDTDSHVMLCPPPPVLLLFTPSSNQPIHAVGQGCFCHIQNMNLHNIIFLSLDGSCWNATVCFSKDRPSQNAKWLRLSGLFFPLFSVKLKETLLNSSKFYTETPKSFLTELWNFFHLHIQTQKYVI